MCYKTLRSTQPVRGVPDRIPRFKFRKQITLMLFGMLLYFPLQAQITIKGVVKDSVNNEGMPGVSILVKGTTSGTTTDNDGRYTLELTDANKYLIFTFIGYKRQEIF